MEDGTIGINCCRIWQTAIPSTEKKITDSAKCYFGYGQGTKMQSTIIAWEVDVMQKKKKSC